MSDHMVIGLGQIGQPLCDVLGAHGRDLETYGEWLRGHPLKAPTTMHICFPFSGSFSGAVVGYIDRFRPAFCVIHSTVLPGTTQEIAMRALGCDVLYSPVRGRHGKMTEDLLYFTKYIAGFDMEAVETVAGSLAGAGMRVQIAPDARALELAKLLQTSFTGLLVAWAQEVQRYCDELGVDYGDACELFREMPNLPPVLHRPGYIGGHCIMPNINLLRTRVWPSPLLTATAVSNERWERVHGRGDGERVWPKPWRQYV